MRKSAPAAFLIAGSLVFAGLFVAAPAYADDEEDDDKGSSEVVEIPGGQENSVQVKPFKPIHKEGEEKRKEIEEKYGKKDRLSVPPLVIRPKRDADQVEAADEDTDDDSSVVAPAPDAPLSTTGSLKIASTDFIAINPMSLESSLVGGQGQAVNPQQNTPIDISNVRLTRKTPAEVFIQASQVGLYAMGAGALALGLLTASRAIRRK